MPFTGVLLDWRGTLAVSPDVRTLVRAALQQRRRPSDDLRVDAVVKNLTNADPGLALGSLVDTDSTLHQREYAGWFARAGVDDELAETLYALDVEPELNPFAADAVEVLSRLHDQGVRIGVLSDIHVDIRPLFALISVAGDRSLADLVDAWILSFEVGLAKPDPAIFALALQRLDLAPHQVLMVGDRSAWDGAAVECGLTTLLLPPLRHVDEQRLSRVLDLVLPEG